MPHAQRLLVVAAAALPTNSGEQGKLGTGLLGGSPDSFLRREEAAGREGGSWEG